jgi:hypothetical protein
MTRLHRRAALALIASAPFAAPSARAQIKAAAMQVSQPLVTPIEITSRPITTFSKTSNEKRFGRLEFRGGLVLSSTEKDFGGLSGIAIEPDGKRFLAIADQGHWLSGELAYNGHAPTGIVRARMGPILATNGRELVRKRDADSEAVALLEGNLTRGTVLIAFERYHRIGRFPIVDGILQRPAGYLKMPQERMSGNKGLEAMTVMTGGPYKGMVVAMSERLIDRGGNHTGWIWIGGEPKRFNLTDVDGFDLTDLASLPDGSLLILERRFRWTEGVKLQLRLLKPTEFEPGKIAHGEILLSTDMTAEIDNVEGLSVHRDGRGDTILTMISDDNFNSFLQRTQLLQFKLS